MSIGLVAATGCVTCLLLALEATRRERAVVRDWDADPTTKSGRTYAALEARLREMAHLVDVTLGRALELHEAGLSDEALRTLGVAHKHLRLFVADMLGVHAGMLDFSHTAPALAGVTGLPVRRLRRPALVVRACLANAAQTLLVSAGERFRMRLVTIRDGLLLLNATLEREHLRPHRSRRRARRTDWSLLAATRSDLATLTDETLESLRLLLAALGAQRRGRACVLAQEPRG